MARPGEGGSRTCRLLAAAAIGLWLAACGSGGSAGAPADETGAAPEPEPPPAPPSTPDGASTPFEVMSYNVAWGRPAGRRLDDAAAIIAESGADVVGVQQLRRFARVQKGGDYGCADQPALLAEMLRKETGDPWDFVFAANVSHRQTTRHCVDVTTHPREEGVSVFSRFPIRSRAAHDLPHDRGLAEARVKTPGGEVTVFSVHLDTESPGRRVAQAKRVADLLGERNGPIVLTGDLNGKPGSEPVRILLGASRDSFADAGVGDGRTRRSRIDYVLYRGLKAERCYVMRKTASDHRPVLARFRPRDR